MTDSPNVILIHGGNRTSWWWHRVIPRLRTGAVAVDLPGRHASPADRAGVTLDDCAETTLRAIDLAGRRRVTLVAHSLGALTALEAVRRARHRVSGLVLIASLVPPTGRTLTEVMPLAAQWSLRMRLRRRPQEMPPPPRWLARRLFCNDMDQLDADALVQHLVPEPSALRDTPVRCLDTLRGIPVIYVRTLRDRAVTSRRQAQSIRVLSTAGAVEVVEVDGGHDVMLSRPDDIARILNTRC
jgi:pimeloyl-ACP methyl ester carboxylesterase